MDMTAAFREVGTYRGAAAMCGCDPKTIKRALARLGAGDTPAVRKEPERNYDVVCDVVAARVRKTAGKISANRQYDSIDEHARQVEQWILDLTPQQASRKAGILSPRFWLRHFRQNFWPVT